PEERGVVTPAFCAFDCAFIILIVCCLFFVYYSLLNQFILDESDNLLNESTYPAFSQRRGEWLLLHSAHLIVHSLF
ncbi:MAG: hypothetical protein IJK08_03640, partial [Prevotella sp.]|nr:hypothetical protein [Prevotella sp.]